jgi:DNA-directed RNA polymerase alpha subunit
MYVKGINEEVFELMLNVKELFSDFQLTLMRRL